MKATEAKFLEFLKKSPQFVIPIYQRTYSWTVRECQQLWDDILRAGNNEAILAHFVGSIVYIEKDIYQVTSQSPLLVIDGQQRLTTVTLLLSALALFLDGIDEDQREPVLRQQSGYLFQRGIPFSYQLSAISYQLSAISYQLSEFRQILNQAVLFFKFHGGSGLGEC